MIIKRYRNGKIVEEHIKDGSISGPKIFRNNETKKRVISNPSGIPAKNPVIIKKPKKGCGCGRKK